MWEVAEVQNLGESVYVRTTRGPMEFYVHPPNFIEKLVGITFEKKIQIAIKRCQKWCDKKNEKEAEVKRAIFNLENGYVR